MKKSILIITLLLLALTTGIALAQAPEGQELPAYTDVITAEAISQDGGVDVHQVGDRWYLEIPQAMFGRELLWYAEAAEVPASLKFPSGGNAIGSKVVRFERRGNTVYVADLSGELAKRAEEPFPTEDQPPSEPSSEEPLPAEDQPTSDEKVDPTGHAVAEASLPALMLALPVVTEGPDGSVVVDVTGVFAADIPGLSAMPMISLSGAAAPQPAPDRSYLDSVRAFPTNTEVRSFLTFDDGASGAAFSIVVRHSLTLLPDVPMQARYFDPRVGYYTNEYTGFDAAGSTVVSRQLIDRYRLEKKDPTAEISDPVKPIVFYIGRNVPDKWRPYLKQAVEDWQVAFEAAGFSNAIIAQDAPSAVEDPDWDPADTRYSVIRWIAQDVANAMGPHLSDPRSGEILSAHILIWPGVLELAEQWYFSQASGIDPRARSLPLPDALMGEILRYIVGHEVGHSLGLRHNHRASQVFTIEQLRDPAFTDQYGTAPSIMSYGRFNYIAQPEDGVTSIIPRIGPYDIFAIEWGYKPIPDAVTPADEFSTLDAWAARQLDDPYLVFGGEDVASVFDPNVLTENLGSDRLEATRLGLLNLERAMGYLVAATTQEGGDFTKLNTMYNAILDTRGRWLDSVVKLIGGVEENRTLAGRAARQFTPVPRDQKEAALAFVLANLQTPAAAAFLPPEVTGNVSPVAATAALSDQQKKLVEKLLDPLIYLPLYEQVILDPEGGYPLVDYLGDIQAGLFAELTDGTPQVEPLRRELQRHYLATLTQRLIALNGDASVSQGTPFDNFGTGRGTDLRGATRFNLIELAATVKAAIPNTTDAATQAHLADLLAQIEGILDGSIYAGQ